MEHPSYSSNLSSCDFHVFGQMRKYMAGKHFTTDDELKEVTLQWLREIGCKFLNTRIRKLVPRYKCSQTLGDYVEK